MKRILLDPHLGFGSARNFARAVLGCIVVGLLLALIFVLAWIKQSHTVSTTTTSPANAYSVNLKGGKHRPWLLPVAVIADVYKMGEPFVADIWLHEADDAFDLSFEAGFPDVRWPGNNVVEFYREQYFNRGSDSLIVQNNTGQYVKYLLIQSVNKFLVVDIEPGASLSVNVPAPRGDTQRFSIEGAFADGTKIPVNVKRFDRSSTQRVHHTYLLSILQSGSMIEAKGAQER